MQIKGKDSDLLPNGRLFGIFLLVACLSILSWVLGQLGPQYHKDVVISKDAFPGLIEQEYTLKISRLESAFRPVVVLGKLYGNFKSKKINATIGTRLMREDLGKNYKPMPMESRTLELPIHSDTSTPVFDVYKVVPQKMKSLEVNIAIKAPDLNVVEFISRSVTQKGLAFLSGIHGFLLVLQIAFTTALMIDGFDITSIERPQLFLFIANIIFNNPFLTNYKLVRYCAIAHEALYGLYIGMMLSSNLFVQLVPMFIYGGLKVLGKYDIAIYLITLVLTAYKFMDSNDMGVMCHLFTFLNAIFRFAICLNGFEWKNMAAPVFIVLFTNAYAFFNISYHPKPWKVEHADEEELFNE